MKQFILLLSLFICFAKGFSQNRIYSWDEYQKEVIEYPDNSNYIYVYYTRGGHNEKLLYYFNKDKQQKLAVNVNDSVVKEISILSPALFDLVSENKASLKKVIQYNASKKNMAEFSKNMESPNVTFVQLGIKLDDLHYNHFQKKTEDFISDIRDEKLKQGFRIINTLIDLLENKEIQQ